MTLAADLAKPTVAPVFLLETTCGLYCPFWAVHSGAAYKLAVSDRVAGVGVNGVDLTAETSAANVVSNAGTWYWDGAYLYIHLVGGGDPNIPTTVVMAKLLFRFADKTTYFDNRWTLYAGAAYQFNIAATVTGVTVNGSALTHKNNPSGVQTFAGTWYWNSATEVLYARMSDDSDPNSPLNVIVLDPNGTTLVSAVTQWEGRLKEIPSLSFRIEPDFKADPQTGGGKISLVNNDKFFNSRVERDLFRWDYGQSILRMGTAGLAWSDYVVLATWDNRQLSLEDTKATLELVEPKSRLKRKFPLTVYDYTLYPNMAKEDLGQAVQQSYGYIYGAKAVCIDVGARQFKVAGHEINGFDAFRVKDNSGLDTWNTVNPATTSTTDATFTLSSADWEYGQDVVVDFRGKENLNGSLMENPADIIKDILAGLGETELDTAAFTAAHNWYDIGYYPPYTTRRAVICAPSLYLDEQKECLDTITNICRDARAYLITNALGQFSVKPFQLKQEKSLVQIEDGDILEFKQEGDPEAVKASKVIVNYGHRRTEDWFQTISYERAKNQYTRDQSTVSVSTIDSCFHRTSDALALAEWMVNSKDLNQLTFSMKLKFSALLWVQGDQIYLKYTERGITKVLEVIELKHNLTEAETQLKLGNMRGFDACQGFWVDDSETTPLGASLAWSASESDYKRFNSGHWHSATDFATSSPTSALDRRVAVWS